MTTPDVVTKELAALANAFGGPRWAQGPGGNVSVKHDGTLFVKASGTRLATVADAGGHVAVDLADATRALEGDAEADARVFAARPRPSLETYFHALGAAVVAHTHPVSVLLAACAARSPEPLGLPVVPYERPGRGLALAVARTREAAAAAGGARAVMLESHGLLVDAATADEAIAISHDVAERCRAWFGADLASFDDLLARYLSRSVFTVEGGFARQLPPRAHLDRYLFPDAVVYASVARVRRLDVEKLPRAVAELGRAVVVVDDANARVAFAKTRSALDSCVEVCAAHDWVESVLGREGLPRYLADDEPAMILDLPSEKYRMRLE